MVEINVILRDGNKQTIVGTPGETLMEALRDNGVDDVLAICGGCCSCATCHVYVEDGPDAIKTPASEMEIELLDTSEHRIEQSRLSCQIEISDDLEGLKIRVAPED